MSSSCVPSFLQFSLWLGDIVRSLFPWAAVVLFALLFPPVRRIFVSLAESMQGLRSFKAIGVEFTLDPGNARELRAKSTAVVLGDYERKANDAIRRHLVWHKFKQVISQAIEPVAGGAFRCTIHIQDVLEPQSLYQLADHLYVGEPMGPPGTRGRRNSIKFGIIGRAWRLGKSDYDPHVGTKVENLVEKWGMTRDEAERAGRGRQSFAVILLRDSNGDCPGLIFIDSQEINLFGHLAPSELERRVTEVAGRRNGLSDSVARVKNALAQEFREPAD